MGLDYFDDNELTHRGEDDEVWDASTLLPFIMSPFNLNIYKQIYSFGKYLLDFEATNLFGYSSVKEKLPLLHTGSVKSILSKEIMLPNKTISN